jgi:hypothetical protein
VSGPASGTLYIIVVENSPDIATVTDVVATSATTGQATIVPGSPSRLLAGSHQGTFTITACLNDPSCNTGQLLGSPKTITVNYNVGSSLDADTVNPRVVQSNIAGNLILRGRGFGVSDSVTIGSTVIAASSISHYTDSDMGVPYPALPAGTYPISINSGALSYSATLTVVDPTVFPATFLSYPAGMTPSGLLYLEYDAQRRALFFVAQQVLLRYAFDGSNWSSPSEVAIPGLQQVHLSPDGTKLLALVTPPGSQASIAELDPVTLSQGTSTSLPTSIATLDPADTRPPMASFSVANDGNAIVVLNSSYFITGPIMGPPSNYAFVFGTSSRVFSLLPLYTGLGPDQPISSGDGNTVAMGSAEYNASGGTVIVPGNNPIGGFGSSSDLIGDKFVEPNPPSTYPGVFNDLGGMMGYFPPTEAAVINSAGTRAYVVERPVADPSLGLHIFDTSAPATASPSQYPELTPALAFAADPGVGSSVVSPIVAISVDSGTVFVAGANGIAVQPVPQ